MSHLHPTPHWLSAAVLAVVFCGATGATNAAVPQAFEYLYIEPNSGDSSGGHTAICFAERCYHFQQDAAQTIRLRRDAARELDYRYRLLGNRTIHATRVDLAPDTYQHLRSAFQSRWQIEERQYEQLQSLIRDRQLIERIGGRAGEDDADAVRVPGSGYFVADARDRGESLWSGEADHLPAQRSATIERLAARVGATYGFEFIEQRITSLRAAIQQLVPEPVDDTLPEDGKLPLAPAGFATRHRELLSGWLALEVLRAAPPLRDGSFHAPTAGDFALQPAEIDVLKAAATHQAETLVRLLASQRPDWGYPLLIGMARLVAIEASIDSGRLVLLDDFPDDAASIAPASVARHTATLTEVREERHAEFLTARRSFFEAPARQELDLSLLETTGNLLIDIGAALQRGAPLRVYSGAVVPTKSARRSDWPLPEIAGGALVGELATALRREGTYRNALAGLYHYDLFSQNCVTEIFRTMEGALTTAGGASDPSAVRAASRAALGGYVECRGTLNFIPFLSAMAVGDTYHVSSRAERPSSRSMKLEQMYRVENALRVDLRESNVLTAQSYERNDNDPIFLFFTDDVLLRRPLYGIVNLAAGIGGTLAGLVWLPVDRGATLLAGFDGALFSLPELAFVNIRKGSFAFAPQSWLADDDSPSAAAGIR